jgi:hypothetical protein
VAKANFVDGIAEQAATDVHQLVGLFLSAYRVQTVLPSLSPCHPIASYRHPRSPLVVEYRFGGPACRRLQVATVRIIEATFSSRDQSSRCGLIPRDVVEATN